MSVDIIRVQARLLEMAKQVTSILESHDIPYMLSYGTLLGAIRHQGFIPWDDDFDLFLFDDDTYEKARVALTNNLSSDLFLEDEAVEEKYYHAWSRVKCRQTHKHSSFYPLENAYKNQGLSIDLFKLKKIYRSHFNHYLIQEGLLYLDRLRRNGLISEEDFKNQSLHQRKFTKKEKEKEDETLIYAAIVMQLQYSVNDIHPLKKYKFADTYFYGPHNYHNILTTTYGDYMTLPPEEKRKVHYDSVVFL